MSTGNHVGRSNGGEPPVGFAAQATPVSERLIAGRYRLEAKVGSGGEGETFRAIDTAGVRPKDAPQAVALKLFRGGGAALDGRVRSEFQRLAGMAHPGLVRALDLGRDAGQLFLVTELLTGAPLSSIPAVSDESARRRLFLRAAWELADALAYLHGRGVVHGDVSPENVRIAGDGRAVLIDLGACGLVTDGAAVGTFGFAAPEALVGRLLPASDLFSLGATLFYAWTGTAPFGVGAQSLVKLLSEPAPALSDVRSGLGEEWDRLVAALLRAAPEQRPASGRNVLRELALLDPARADEERGAVALLPPFPAGDPLAGIFVGRASQRAIFKRLFQSVAEGASPHTVVAVSGPEGSGRRTLIDVALRDLAIAQISESSPPVRVYRGPLGGLMSWLQSAAGSVGANRASPQQERRGPEVGRPEVGRPEPERPDSGELNQRPSLEPDPLKARERLFAELATILELRAATDPLVVALTPGVDEAAFASFLAGAPGGGHALVIVIAGAPLSRLGALDLALAPLELADVHELLSRAVGEEVLHGAMTRVAAAAAGHAATLAVLARQFVLAVRQGQGEAFAPGTNLALDKTLSQSLEMMPPNARRLVAMVELGLLAQETDAPGSRLAAEDLAVSAGWLTRRQPGLRDGPTTPPGQLGDDDLLHLPSGAHRAVFRRALGDPAYGELRDLAQLALERSPPVRDEVRGVCLEALGKPELAADAFLSAAEKARGWGADAAQAEQRTASWLEEAARLAPSRLDPAQLTALATFMAGAGRNQSALALLDAALASPSSPAGELQRQLRSGLAFSDRLELTERKAWLLARGAQLDSARVVLQEALSAAPPGTPSAQLDPALARLARVLVSLGRFSEAIEVAARCTPESNAGVLARESAILAHAYAGELPAAWRLHATWTVGEHRPPTARALHVAALLHQLEGDLGQALAAYRHAWPDAESSGDIHTVAAIALNMGAVAAESGHYTAALTMQERAIRELGRLGSTTEVIAALFNAAMTLLELGDLAGARALVSRLRHELEQRGHGSPGAAPPALATTAAPTYLEAELALRQGDESLAAELFTEASNAAGLDAPVGRAAFLALAELLGRARQPDRATALLDELEAAGGSPRALADVRLVRAKVLLAGAAPGLRAALARAPGLPAAVAEDAARAAREGRRPRAWKGALTAARLYHRAGDTAHAAEQVERARRLFEEVRMSTPADRQSDLDTDPDARFLQDLARVTAAGSADIKTGTDARPSRGSGRSEGRLRRLLRINKRLNSELRLPRLLELIMDTVIELTESERGFILLEDDKGELVVKVARNIDQQTLETGAFELSRSIARQAAAGGTPIVTIDAAGDPRFREALSVSDLHLRSVLAVPLLAKGRAVGTLYVDNRLRRGAFGEDDVQLVLDFAEQAGIAIENARLLSELRRRERQIEVLNRKLQGELATRKEELVGMKQELRANREALAIRYDYRNIIGRTPRMQELFRLLDRLTDTALPVVIQGESGTGKELVARALHFNGPRRERAFVSENCAAIPETLLESTLFGAVRGAYTGADHDARGLFEVADGGTLFLDEVGEMSAAMQGKLLRVLQSGELRRVGSERMRKVDVRVIAATNRDLGRMVERGQFRQDLFFRLSVAPITLPPLRDRRDDIPAIVEHVLSKPVRAPSRSRDGGGIEHDGGGAAPKRVTAAAMGRLAGYRWPGNVRELENELMRASALSDELIDVRDLSPHIAGEAETALTTLEDPDSLALRPRVERLERALLREALTRSGGNQTRAAEALGLSRFGLQKKMNRYQIR